jgi:CRP/FNR family transcriptional regulator
MSRSDIASYLGLAVETVSRVLARFQEGGVIAVRGRQVRLLDLSRLKTRIDPGTLGCNREA